MQQQEQAQQQRRTTTPERSSTASMPSTAGRATSPRHCSCSAGRTGVPSPGNASTCHCSRKRPPRASSPSRKSAASPWRRGATSPPRPDRRRFCCS
ncbi:hypothetical protein SGL43_03642 [Streptomyces globisporus]|uniref:Uncharacterized protein n=1 Tax=Streptomyces globisporus TaxID=1908 RepID=A0ABM9GYS8_STRGL|nr:hypothetical protein SGL43_03642 [Streptomyces globisporus]